MKPPTNPNYRILKLSEVLEHADDYSDPYALYMKIPDGDWSGDLDCAVLDIEDSPDPGEIHPEFALAHSMVYVLFISDVHGVIGNARLQEPDVDTDDLVVCLQYYWEHDAFTTFS